MPTIGELLRCERLKSGLELERIAQQTKIAARFLSAIEEEQFEKLPGSLFTVSFVRQYARALGLDEDQVLAQFRAEQEPPPPPVIVAAPVRRQPASSATLLMMASVALVTLLVTGGVARWRVASPALPEVPGPTQGSADRSAVPESSQPTLIARNVPPKNEAARTEPATVNTPLQLVLKAKTPTWVGAKVDGKNVFGGVLRPDQSKILENATAVNLVIGNAAGLEISLNGKSIGPIGPPGQVRELQVTSSGDIQIRPHRPALQDIY